MVWTVTLLPKKDFNEVYGVVSVQVGSVDTRFTVDDKGLQQYPQGIAHFLEHKLLKEKILEMLWQLLQS